MQKDAVVTELATERGRLDKCRELSWEMRWSKGECARRVQRAVGIQRKKGTQIFAGETKLC